MVALVSAAFIIVACFLTGALWFNMPSREEFPVWGVDVSHWQGEIDWSAMAYEKLDFVFIKATEGKSFTDERFAENWRGAQSMGIITGAYHFLSDTSSGAEQAGHFIKTVPWGEKMLPPVIDIEVDVQSENTPQILYDMICALEAHYGVKPILYVTHGTYEAFVLGKHDDCPIWIRDIFTEPVLEGGRDWLLWQYSNQGWMPTYSGEGWNIDLNVFSGSRKELRAMLFTPPPPSSTQREGYILMQAAVKH